MTREPVTPFVCTALERADDAVDVVIEFEITAYTPGTPQTYWQPAEPAEYEFRIADIYLDGCPDAAPLLPTERAALVAWFDGAGNDAAYDAAERIDRTMDGADQAYDRYRDELMERDSL